MQDYLLNVMRKQEHGLYLCELPTGIGKSYAAAYAMKEYADSIKNNRKIIYLTTLNKNLLEDELKNAYGDEELYKKNVLRIRSNFEEVNKLPDIQVPEEMRTNTYQRLCKDILTYKDKKIADKEYIKNLTDRIMDEERQFRYEIRRFLKDKFPTKQGRKKAIENDKKYKWIGELYPAVFTDDYKIILMSISKFMKENSVIIDQSYEFLQSNLIENAVIIIDEFDATKETIQNELIEKSLAMPEDFIQMFRQIYRALDPNDFSKAMKQAAESIEDCGNKNTIGSLKEEAKELSEKYYTRLSMKIREDNVDRRQVFLFNDGSFHTVLKEGIQYVRMALNKEDNRVEIFFESKEEYYKNRNKEKDIVLYRFLRDINSFFTVFRSFSIEWAKHYMEIVNKSRNETDDAMNLENAIHSILSRLGLTSTQCKLLMGERCKSIKNDRGSLLSDQSFYQSGMEYYEFEDNDSHHDYTNLRFVKVYDTPEKVLLYLAKKATVIGISATAEINTVVGNYNLGYLSEQLKEHFHKTPVYLKERMKNLMQTRWEAYDSGKVVVHGEVVNSEVNGFNTEDYCKTFMDVEFAGCSANIITNNTDNEYFMKRYCNVLKAMCMFNQTRNIQSMLYLGMALPKKNNLEMDEGVLKQLFEYSQQAFYEDGSSLFYLRGDNYEKDKEELQQRLANGEKIFVMSSYQTIGAGQNLQYEIPKGKTPVYLGEPIQGDKRFLYKDFDALYLGNITNMTVNTFRDGKITAHDLMHMMFQIEELYENFEINYTKKDQMLKLAFCRYSGNELNQENILYKTKSVLVQASRMVLQAVGRMCRTFVKNPDVYLFIESGLLEHLYAGELKKRILSPEMKMIVSMRESIGKDYLPDENVVLNKAERISSLGFASIRRMLAKNWTVNSMKLWEDLRTLVLQYPTASSIDRQNNQYIEQLYITSGVKQNRYIYSQYADFTDVIIDFGDDKAAFRNSKRAKIKGDSRELIVYEMNEKESGLCSILKYPGMRVYFEKMGYALEFKMNEYLMSPVLFHNIYKGALGEIAGKFILKNELGIELEPITEPNYFEFFDFRMSDDVYVDFKNWKYTYAQDRGEIRKDILRKMDRIGARRVYIINIVSNRNYRASSTVDQRLIEIPMLIKEDGTVCYENLHMIREEDFEYADK